MKGKILFVVGLGVGYVLGTRAGREKYEKIKRSAQWVWDSPPISDARDQVDAFVKAKTPDVAELIADGVKKVVASVAGKPTSKPVAARSSTAKAETAKTDTAKAETTKPAAAKSVTAKPAASKPAAKKPAARKPAAKPTAKSAE